MVNKSNIYEVYDMPDLTPEQAEKKILENAADPTKSYEVDGEKIETKDPLKQVEAMNAISARKAGRRPLGAVGCFRMLSGSGER